MSHQGFKSKEMWLCWPCGTQKDWRSQMTAKRRSEGGEPRPQKRTHTSTPTHSLMTHRVNLWELTQKILFLWYLTLCRLSKFTLYISPKYWRNCGHPCMLLHTLWSCPSISPFCLSIFNLLTQILGFTMALTPDLALLSLGIELIPTPLRTEEIHILLAAWLSLEELENCKKTLI